MQPKQLPISLAVICGAILGLLIIAALSGVLPWSEPGKPYPFWAHLLGKAGDSLASVAPGFFAGYLARRAGLWVGAIAGLLVSVAVALVSSTLSWPTVGESQAITLYFIGNLFAEGSAAAITNGVAGLAGEYLGKSAKPSNIAVKRDAPQAARPLP